MLIELWKYVFQFIGFFVVGGLLFGAIGSTGIFFYQVWKHVNEPHVEAEVFIKDNVFNKPLNINTGIKKSDELKNKQNPIV